MANWSEGCGARWRAAAFRVFRGFRAGFQGIRQSQAARAREAGEGPAARTSDAIPRTWTLAEIEALPDAEALLPATVRWFEDRFTVTPEWPDECYVNHAFAPTGLWHLGFVFAATDLAAGSEITVDYRHLLAPGQEEDFHDAQSGKRIVGYNWNESLRMSSQALLELLA